MSEMKQILDLLAAGKITADEAERLMQAIREERSADPRPAPPSPPMPALPGAPRGKPRFLRVHVVKDGVEKTNVRIPIALIRAGVKLTGLLPKSAKGKMDVMFDKQNLNFNLNELDGKTIDAVIEALVETDIVVDDDNETVRIFCE